MIPAPECYDDLDYEGSPKVDIRVMKNDVLIGAVDMKGAHFNYYFLLTDEPTLGV